MSGDDLVLCLLALVLHRILDEARTAHRSFPGRKYLMPINIHSNSATDSVQKSVNSVQKGLRSSLERLASGYRINRASDDAAGLAISENLRAQIRSLNQARRNTFDGISMVQTAAGALGESSDMLQRMRELAMQSSNGALNDDQRAAIQNEFVQLQSELDRQVQTTEYNGKKLLDGSLSGGNALQFQVGIRHGDADRLVLSVDAMDKTSLGMGTTAVGTQANAAAALDDLDTALERISDQRSDLGAYENRFKSAANTLDIAAENVAAADSRIRDVDVAMESTNLSAQQMLQQATVAVLAQANAQPAVVVNLLGT
jgi:flagellin